MMIAIAISLGHNFMPHHHGHNSEISDYHEEHHEESGHDNDHHKIFSFVQLDENFLPSHSGNVDIDLPIVYLMAPLINYPLRQLEQQSKTHFGYYREHPPPAIYRCDLPLRAPPVFVAV